MKIAIKVYEEIKSTFDVPVFLGNEYWNIEWADRNGINTPYLVTIVNRGE